MRYWLFKSEPSEWSWADQVARGDVGEPWDGVRNYQARNVMREMSVGDLGFFYHSQSEKACVGIVRVIAPAAPDPTDDSGKWDCMTVAAERPLPRPVTLAEIKADPELADMALVKSPRLSVQPVTAAQWAAICAMAGL
ncbi:EVE domain-containing protein [Palleronia sediminis]|uniref:EVE domain-containing protein n=1 Tax=Palleronia sediminis TaxID=2547833 RepID=A0A4R6A080_9RHOB|nr:EVE domain-containing protein [Palleronia sediminis]TDL75228.1 EVE domain-containing protein [Palleronia sediminis]